MGNKSKLNKDAFDWIKDTSKEKQEKNEVPVGKDNSVQKKRKQIPIPQKKGISEVIVEIRYKTNGDIVAIMAVAEAQKTDDTPALVAPADEKVAKIKLIGDQPKKALFEIPLNYKVDTKSKPPKLVLKTTAS